MAAIDDALSAARGAHYGVIAGCAAALLFAATPDLTAPYRAARQDLEALRTIDWKRVTGALPTRSQLAPPTACGRGSCSSQQWPWDGCASAPGIDWSGRFCQKVFDVARVDGYRIDIAVI
jgi:hypothetical protein